MEVRRPTGFNTQCPYGMSQGYISWDDSKFCYSHVEGKALTEHPCRTMLCTNLKFRSEVTAGD